MGFALQLIGSLAAILTLAWLAHRLGLGGDARIGSVEEARELAHESVHGFEAKEVAIDRAGMAALCRDASGRVLLLRRHGSHWAGRLIDSGATARLDRSLLTLAPADRRFGSVTLDLGDQAPAWAASLRRVLA
ncbi:hypothetical protein [Qipengyuania sediminis]|uniref:hypothetical protein n=1 Tax=Qipengyuania sediminis TaxID=1532023 RepID=UPI001059952A|nr:hypothetical protein [Qipengyuania sediminis]